jgi:hypothetical protein
MNKELQQDIGIAVVTFTENHKRYRCICETQK